MLFEGFVFVIFFCCFYNIIFSIYGICIWFYIVCYLIYVYVCFVNNNFLINSRVLECKSSFFVIGKY